MSALDDIQNRRLKWTALEQVILSESNPSLQNAAADEYIVMEAHLVKWHADWLAAIKANVEVANLNADFQERIAAQQEAIELAKEAIDLYLTWGPKTQSDEHLIETRLAEALEKLVAL